ncbi:MAG: tape measure protein, partial [Galactobacter sp.]
MAMTAAELVAYLRLDSTGFDKGMQGAKDTLRKSDGSFRKWAGGVGQFVGNTLVGATAGTGALATAAFKTGVQYNTLQQTSRAALKTIMGSGEKANAQMDKLDAFAKNSPFAKDVFIKVQQQLLGFGMTAEDVVPTMDAIQQSVAAVGGSNDDIAEIGNILATVTGTGKITAETLNQLGTRGINAADIIGEQMGKSGNAIRESITKGTLDADKAVAALTKGMQKRFGGAADGVKETMVGATDRIKGAFRDIGATMAKPFVDPKGGGLAVDWANEFADVLRAIEGQAKDMVPMLMDRFAPAFGSVSVALKDAKDAVKAFDLKDLERGLDKISDYAPAVGALSGVLFTLGTRNIPVIGGLAKVLGPIPAALAGAAAASPEMRAALGNLLEAAAPLTPVLGDVAETAAGVFTDSVELAADVLEDIVGVVGPVVSGFTDLPDPVKKAATAIGLFLAAQKLFPGFMNGFKGAARGVVTSASDVTSKVGGMVGGVRTTFSGWGGLWSGAANDALSFRSKIGVVASDIGSTASKGLRGALSGVMGIFGGPWGVALMGAGAALTLWSQKQQEAKNRTEEFKASLDETTGALTDATWDQITTNLSKVEEGFWAWWVGTNGKNAIDFADELGVSMDDMKGYILGTKDGTKALTVDMNAAKASADGNLTSYQALIKALDEQKSGLSGAQKEQLAKIEADKALRESTDEASRAQVAFKDALVAAGDATKSAEDRANSLKTALDLLNGETVSTEEAQRSAAAGARNLSGFFRDGKADSDNFAGSLVNLKDRTIAQSDAGDRFVDLLGDQRTKMLQATQAAYDNAGGNENAAAATKAAREEYKRQTDALQKVYEKAGLSTEQIEFLNQEYLDTPDKVITTIGLAGKKDFEADVNQLTRARSIVFQASLKPGTVMADAVALGNAVSGKVNRAPKGQGYGVFKPGYGGTPKYWGGIDVKGMAAGGVTGASMSVAQMVKPGEIRFAGDRSDVDEAWIPLDGSSRSWKILQEAITRMPGQAKGMADGGVVSTVEPPTVESVTGPDTSELTGSWDTAMLDMLASTEAAFQQIQTDTADGTTAATTATTSGQQAQTSDTQVGNRARQQATQASEASQTALTQAGNQARTAGTKAAGAQQVASTRSSMQSMDAQVSSSMSRMRGTTISMWTSMAATTRDSSSAMRSQASREFTALASNLEATRRGPMRNTFSALSDTMRHQMPAAARAGADSYGAAWDSVRAKAQEPVRFIIDTVYNSGIRGVWNKVADEFDSKNTLPAFRPAGFWDGGYTGAGGKYQKAGDVHRGEYVLRQEATSKLRSSLGMTGLDHMNRTGELPGYADGGFVRPVKGGHVWGNYGTKRPGGAHTGEDIALAAGSPIVAALP